MPPVPPLPQATTLVDRFIETPLLQGEHDAWAGLRFGYFRAADHDDQRHIWLPHPCIGMLTHGRARATIRSGLQATDIAIGVGVAGIFGPEFDVYRSVWHCEDARRLFFELAAEAYERVGLADELLSSPLRQDLASPDPDLRGMLCAILEEQQQGRPHGRVYAEALVQGLLRHVHRRYGQAPRADRPTGARLTLAQLRRVRDFVQAHLGDDVGLADLAAAAGVGRAQVARLFRNSLGQSPHAFLVAERLRHAQRLLVGSEQGLALIAAACGFASQSHFSMQFRRATGLAPGAFRAAYGRRLAAAVA